MLNGRRNLKNKNLLWGVIFFLLIGKIGFAEVSQRQVLSELDFNNRREQMIVSQIEARGIKNKALLKAMRKVKRHLFVPPKYRHLAYVDNPLPIGEGQTISQPYIVALMSDLLRLKGDERVLEIGTGSGYQAAVLAELAKEVYSIEIVEPLAKRAENLLTELDYENIKVKCGDGYLGWNEYAPFEAIIITCAPPEIPQPLIEQLAEGGRMVVPLGVHWQELKLVEKLSGRIKTRNIIPVRFVPMTGEGVKMTSPITKAAFVWSKEYKASLGKGHIFPAIKYQRLYSAAIKQKILKEEDIFQPQPLNEEDLLLVHTKSYLRKLKLLALSPAGMLNGENPVSPQILRAVRFSCGGTYLACKLALKCEIGMNLGGGFHHASSNREEGFCYYNDIALAVKKLQKEDGVKKVMVIDCDVHQGNGTAMLFQDDDSVFIFDIYQEDNYPTPKVKVDYAVSLNSGAGITDKKYLKELTVLPKLIDKFGPELIIYIAGADPYQKDRLGGFSLSKEGLKKRDEYVIGLAKKKGIPIGIALGGGYAEKTEDTVELHLNTIKAIKSLEK